MKFIEYSIYFLLKILSMLPRKFKFLLGKFLGFIFFSLSRERREIARWNLKKCFPEKDSTEINSILKASFYRLGESLFEFLDAFLSNPYIYSVLETSEDKKRLDSFKDLASLCVFSYSSNCLSLNASTLLTPEAIDD